MVDRIQVRSSGPLAVVVAGMLVGSRGPCDALSDQTKRSVRILGLVDEVLNSVLFLLIVMSFAKSSRVPGKKRDISASVHGLIENDPDDCVFFGSGAAACKEPSIGALEQCDDLNTCSGCRAFG